MDFAKFKQKAQDFTKKVIDTSATKLQESGMVIKDPQGVQDMVDASKNHINDQGKEYPRRSVVIFAEAGSEFYKEALYILPVVYTKAWTQNVRLKMCSLGAQDLQSYSIKSFPTMIVFEDTKETKRLEGTDNIKKIVKSMNLDINACIDSL